jgi:hypothetical protein
MSLWKPVAALVREDVIAWRIELRTLKGIRELVGPETLNAFGRSFVTADRLTSLIGLAYLSKVMYRERSVGLTRNIETLVWFTVGTLGELVLAVCDLRAAAAAHGVLDPSGVAWCRLRAFEDRWDRDPFFQEMRHVVQFGADRELITRGLNVMEDAASVILSESGGGTLQESSVRIGLDAVLNGSGKSFSDFDRFMHAVNEDRHISATLHEAFLLVLQAKGVSLEEIAPVSAPVPL